MNWYTLTKESQSIIGVNNLGNTISGDVIGKTKNILDHDLLKIKTINNKIEYLKPWEIKTQLDQQKKQPYEPHFVDYLFSGVKYKKGKVLPNSMFLDKIDNETVFILHADPQTGSKKIVRIRADQILKKDKTK
ncbi:hypothetical protein CMI47_20695 [Candidatus Pacearchaeota archaeon]|jgi:hypothetical protein|nr:hypothetical protein [Candidatus Pacearchaeota archaeon]|tara:strand:- start:352 stop:750 length:399 start_codon:yes stop_codon:yes gene_type:complete